MTLNTGTTGFSFGGMSSSQKVGDPVENITVYEITPNCGNCDYAVNTITITITVLTSTSGIVTVTSPVTIGAGGYYVTSQISSPTAAGSYTLEASATGFATSDSGTVVVSP